MNKDYIARVFKTFIQAVVSALVVFLADGVDFTNKEAVKTLIVGVIAAGISAVMNINKVKKQPETIAEEVPKDEFITEDEKC